MTYKTILNETTGNFFNSLEIKRESWLIAENKIEEVNQALLELNTNRDILSSEEFSSHLECANLFIKNGYSFLDNNKEVLQDLNFHMLKSNTEISLANTLTLLVSIESYQFIKSISSGLKKQKNNLQITKTIISHNSH